MKALKSNAIGRCAKPSQMRRLVARVLVVSGVMVGALFVSCPSAQAVNWTGAIDADMNNAGNWDAPVNLNGVLIDIGAAGASNAFTVGSSFQGAGGGIGNMTISRPAGLSINNLGAVNLVGLRFAGNAGVTIDAGTGAVNFGGANNAYLINMGTGTSNFNNNSVTTTNINSNVQLNPSGGTNPIVAFGGTGNWNVTGTTSGTVKGVIKNGNGGLTLGGSNSHIGETIVNAGTLTITNANALGATGALNDTHIIGANGSTGSTLILSGSALTIAETLNFNANAIGRSGLTNNNAFNQVLNGPIDVSSTVNLVQWNSSGAGSITINGDITGTMTGGSLLFLRGSSTSVNNRIRGSMNIIGGNFAKTDDGVWTIGNAGETYSWNNTQVARGTVRLNLANMLPSATIVTVGQGTDPAAATLDLNGFNQTVSGLSKLGAGTNKQITNTSGTAAILTVNNAAASNYAGRINGNLGLTKSGVGTLTLADINGYSGNTVINQGTLALGSAGSIDNSPVISIGTGATFNVSAATGYNLVSGQSIIGNGSILGDVIADAGSLLSPGFSVGDIGTLAFANSLDINGSVLIEVDAAAAGQKIDIINVGNVLDISGASLTFSFLSAPGQNAFVFSNYGSLVGEFANISVLPVGYQVQYNFGGNNQIALVSIPEPATMSLLALGGLAMLRRRRVMR